MSDPWYLVADIGGTNARFAAFHGNRQVDLVVHDTKRGGDLLSMAKAFCERAFPKPPVVAVAAAAGPVKNNALKLTNANQSLCGEDLKQATKAREAYIINDFSAAAWSSLAVGPEDVLPLSGTLSPRPGTRLVIGPGTGLGVGALVYANGQYNSVPGEGGHIGLGPRNRYEVEVFDALRKLWPGVFFGDAMAIEAEGFLSGTGLPYLYRAVQEVEGLDGPALDARDIFDAAKNATDTAAVKSIEIFKTHLAQVAGDLGLAFGADGGVFFVGGVALKNTWMFDDQFLAAFHQGGRFTAVRESFGLYLVNRSDFGLLGAHKFAEIVSEAQAVRRAN